MKGSLNLGELEGSLHLLEIRCTKCDRYARERLTRMIERYGREARLPDVRHRLAADCPYQEAAVYERCLSGPMPVSLDGAALEAHIEPWKRT
jgi:hypothetical protein